MKENKDYELILGEDTSENWNVRILTGDFVETVIEYKACLLYTSDAADER